MSRRELPNRRDELAGLAEDQLRRRLEQANEYVAKLGRRTMARDPKAAREWRVHKRALAKELEHRTACRVGTVDVQGRSDRRLADGDDLVLAFPLDGDWVVTLTDGHVLHINAHAYTEEDSPGFVIFEAFMEGNPTKCLRLVSIPAEIVAGISGP